MVRFRIVLTLEENFGNNTVSFLLAALIKSIINSNLCFLVIRFFNWIPDSSIILMQPEGSTTECLSCYSSGTFTLRPFDDKNLSPTPGRKMAIHIPIVAEGNTLYSYWLSYRSGVDGLYN